MNWQARAGLDINSDISRLRLRRDLGGWHDNSALDLINEEISVLEARFIPLENLLKSGYRPF